MHPNSTHAFRAARGITTSATPVAAILLAFAAAILLAPVSTKGQSTTPTLTVDAAGNPHPINPDIYGIANYNLDATFAKEIQVPNIRWGGDGTTRYNWQVDSSNAGFDWYFMGGNGQSTATPSASADLMINTYKTASNAHTLLTIPIIPYVNKSAAWSCSFPVSVYGAQQSTNPYVHPNGDDCGNSIAANGTQLIDNNIYANHIDNTVALQQGWIQHLITTFGTAANGGVPYYQLDNEPGGWSNTHRDVEPTQPGYNTIISLGQQYAAMIKQSDPSAKVFGPVDFTLGGWIGTPSKQNNLYAGQYYLQQMAAYDATNHQRILDYFDEHYYGGGSTDAAELESTRALWDPTFNSGSWVEQYYFDAPMQLIPRFQNWIQTYYPGTKLSISEYSFSSGTNPLVDALTEADVLGIYGRQSLDFANLWTVPAPTDPVAYSFRIYRNYDGAGSQFGNTSVNSTSTDQSQLSVYGALRSSDGALTVVAINKTTAAIQTSLTLANYNASSTAAVYTYSNANLTQILTGSPVSVASNTVSYNFQAYSVTVFVFTTSSDSTVASKTSVSASSTEPTQGQSVTITASVAPASGSGTPTGSITFADRGTQLGTVTLVSGQTAFTTSTLSVGSHSITAAYSGDASFAASTSAAVDVTVVAPAKRATTTTVLASATQLTTGQKLTLSIGVAPQSGSGSPTGAVTVLDGPTQIGSATLVASAATFSTNALAVGSDSLTVSYSGDSTFATSTSNAVSVTVSAPPKLGTATALTVSATQINSGASVTFTAKVLPQSGQGTPTGTATFLDGQTQIGSSALTTGSAQFSTSSLSSSTHRISASYSGDSNYSASTSSIATITVSAAPQADYTLTSSTSLTVDAGKSAALALTVTPQNGFKSTLNFACSNLPSGASCNFNPQSLTPSGAAVSTAMTINVPSGAAAQAQHTAAAPPQTRTLFALAVFVSIAIFGFVAGQGHRHRVAPLLAGSVALAAILVAVGCAGQTSSGPPPPSQTYAITVTASGSGAPTHAENITLVVP
ncbi:MAG: Ig-like domain repeat protein [Candidatus Acidiferrales bacterium]